jgi:ADP-dependent NAD(P)H-hydrate dehydratase / NAD(P)H-hydrate epimerase
VHHEQLLHLSRLLGQTALPVVVDASALFLLATEPSLLLHRPQGSITILTPHVGEFDRMFGHCPNDFERLRRAIAKAVEFKVIIVLKGAYTRVITPGGLVYFNSTGNPGMAKGGSGDVLTGLLAGLLAQRYPDVLAALMAVYLHGSAGDIAAAKFTQQGMTALDIARSLPAAWKSMGA